MGAGSRAAPLPGGSPPAASLLSRSPAPASDGAEESESEDGSAGQAPLVKKLGFADKRDTPKKDKEKAGTTDISALEDAVALLSAFKESVDPNYCATIEKRLATMQQYVKMAIPAARKKALVHVARQLAEQDM